MNENEWPSESRKTMDPHTLPQIQISGFAVSHQTALRILTMVLSGKPHEPNKKGGESDG